MQQQILVSLLAYFTYCQWYLANAWLTFRWNVIEKGSVARRIWPIWFQCSCQFIDLKFGLCLLCAYASYSNVAMRRRHRIAHRLVRIICGRRLPQTWNTVLVLLSIHMYLTVPVILAAGITEQMTG
ncbi:unnamed protein product [Haemonchus placei]|uniref:G_PROTEIN_RECEP_F1_2 domain-containing protein n=1 Tax=Haemonchus placei TaxID=6290 RepID=A0A0N4XBB9_HAEPC|nr:unnamed protein product [Haemonchus placei]